MLGRERGGVPSAERVREWVLELAHPLGGMQIIITKFWYRTMSFLRSLVLVSAQLSLDNDLFGLVVPEEVVSCLNSERSVQIRTVLKNKQVLFGYLGNISLGTYIISI